MNNRFLLFPILFAVLLVSCAQNVSRRDVRNDRDVFQRDKNTKPAIPPEDRLEKSSPSKTYVEQKPASASSAATLALLRDAQAQSGRGDLDAAITTIERAIRIQPRNADLWNRLAEYRLRHGKPRLAEDLAKKSNTLAGKNSGLRRKNWELIASSRRKLGNLEGAMEAIRKAAQY